MNNSRPLISRISILILSAYSLGWAFSHRNLGLQTLLLYAAAAIGVIAYLLFEYRAQNQAQLETDQKLAASRLELRILRHVSTERKPEIKRYFIDPRNQDLTLFGIMRDRGQIDAKT